MSRDILGIDIRRHCLSAVRINSTLKRNRIEAFAHVPVPAAESGEPAMAAALKALTRKIDTADAACVANFPAPLVSFRNAYLPFTGAKKINQTLSFELEPMLPFQGVDDLIINFEQSKHTDTQNQTAGTRILATAVEKARLQSYLDILNASNLDPETVMVGGIACVRCLLNLKSVPENWLLADIGRRSCTVAAIVAERLTFVRTFIFSPDEPNFLDALALNIRRTLFSGREIVGQPFQPDLLYITGCGLHFIDAEPDHVQDKFSQVMSLPVKLLDLAEANGAQIEDELISHWNPSLLDNALAAALIESEGVKKNFNLRSGSFTKNMFWTEHKSSIVKTALLLLLALIAALANLTFEYRSMNTRLAHLDKQIADIFVATFPHVKRVVDPLAQMRINVAQIKSEPLLTNESAASVRTIDIINEISTRIPEALDVKLSRLEVGGNSVTIAGRTDTFNAVDEMKNKLEQGGFFSKIDINTADMDKSGTQVKFKLKLYL
jgi:general secretion pathway protein L